MAISSRDYGALRRAVYRGAGKAALKAAGPLPDKTQLQAAFQAIEDQMIAAAGAARTAIETAWGRPVSVALMAEFIRAWAAWRMER